MNLRFEKESHHYSAKKPVSVSVSQSDSAPSFCAPSSPAGVSQTYLGHCVSVLEEAVEEARGDFLPDLAEVAAEELLSALHARALAMFFLSNLNIPGC